MVNIINDIEEAPEINFVIVENSNLYPEIYKPPTSKPKDMLFFSIVFLIFLSIIGGFSIGLGISFGNSLFRDDIVESTQANITSAINRVMPAVVLINSESETLVGSTTQGSGTGIVFRRENGYVFIVTNEHVISNAFEIYATFNNGRRARATLIGRSHDEDIAVLKIGEQALRRIGITNIETAAFGNSRDVEVGDIAIALGNALGQGIVTTTLGIVSALDIQLSVEDRTLTVMQTDAAINPGNSGGPLINKRGEVVGINTVKLAVENVYGMGYSITSNHAYPIMQMILRGEAQPRIGIQGISVNNINSLIRERYNVNIEEGVFISRVFRYTPIYNAGIIRGNIITHINNTYVTSIRELVEALGENRIGDEVSVTIYDEGFIYVFYIILAA